MLINHARVSYLDDFHNKAVFLNPENPRVPFHSLFLIHECRVRGERMVLGDRALSEEMEYQNWIGVPSNGYLAPKNTDVRLDLLDVNSLPLPINLSLNCFPTASSSPGSSSSGLSHPLSSLDILDTRMKVLHNEITWKECMPEGSSLDTAQKNMDRDLATAGLTSIHD